MASPSDTLLIKALDGLNARAIATAENIANAGTRNYRPLRVSFEDALRQAAGAGEDAVRAVEPQLARATGTDADTGMRLDLEVATASQTALRYSALITILGRQLDLQSLAYKGNNA